MTLVIEGTDILIETTMTLTAKRARNIANEIENQRSKEEIELIEQQIRGAAQKGKFSIYLTKGISVNAQALLEERGFEVKKHYDQREGDSTTIISW